MDRLAEIKAREAAATPGLIAHVYKFKNNMLMVFDENGEQMPQYQGEASPDLVKKIHQNLAENATFDGFGVEGPLDFRTMRPS